MALISRRLLHVVTVPDLAILLTPTYAISMSVEDDEAHDRLTRALERSRVADDLYGALSEALEATKGERTTEDALIDKLSKGLQKRRSRVKAAPSTPGLAAVLVRINVEIGLAPEQMRATLDTDRGRAMLATGLRELGVHFVKELLR